MLPLYPYLAYLRDEKNVSLRAAAREFEISHPYLLKLEEFSYPPQSPFDFDDEAESKKNSQWLNEYAENQLKALDPEAYSKIDPFMDRYYLVNRNMWLHLFITPKPTTYYGPIFHMFRSLYINDLNDHVSMVLPIASSREKSTLRYLTERLYSPDLFRNRFPKLEIHPPFYNQADSDSLQISFDHEGMPDEREIFWRHPLGDSFACFVLYIYLKAFTISSPGIPLETRCSASMKEVQADSDLFKRFSGHRSCHQKSLTGKVMEPHIQVVLYPPEHFFDGNGQKISMPKDIDGIRICLPSLLAATDEYCWCCSHPSP